MDVDTDTHRRIKDLLEEFWNERAIMIETTGTVEELIDELDSLSAVDALIPIEDLLGVEIEASRVIRRGGYEGRDQFVDELSERIIQHVGGL
jgi:acyl carrier protein